MRRQGGPVVPAQGSGRRGAAGSGTPCGQGAGELPATARSGGFRCPGRSPAAAAVPAGGGGRAAPGAPSDSGGGRRGGSPGGRRAGGPRPVSPRCRHGSGGARRAVLTLLCGSMACSSRSLICCGEGAGAAVIAWAKRGGCGRGGRAAGPGRAGAAAPHSPAAASSGSRSRMIRSPRGGGRRRSERGAGGNRGGATGPGPTVPLGAKLNCGQEPAPRRAPWDTPDAVTHGAPLTPRRTHRRARRAPAP